MCVYVYVSRLIVVYIGVWPLASYGHSKVFFRAIDVVVIAANVVLFVSVCVCVQVKQKKKKTSELPASFSHFC